MLPYLFLLSIPLFAIPLSYYNPEKYNKNFTAYLSILLFIFVGLRYQTGGDWYVYLNNFKYYGENFSFDHRSDLGYEFLSYLIYQSTGSFYILNIIIAIFNCYSLYYYCRNLRNPILGFYISLPIIVLVLYMGFVRQGIAFSFLLMALSNIDKKNFNYYYLYIFLGIFFHKSLIFFLIIGIIFDNRILIKSIILILGFLIFLIFLKDFTSLYTTYIGTLKGVYYDESMGATIRLIMNVIPALFLLLFRNRFIYNEGTKKFYIILSVTLIFMFIAKEYAITFIDRLNYYYAIIPLYVFGNIQSFRFGNKQIIINLKYFLIFSYIFVYLFWLLFANHNIGWLPYKNILFNA